MAKEKETVEPIKVEKLGEAAPAAVPAAAPESAPAAVPFFTIKKSESKPAEPITVEEKPRREPVNNILLGEIDEDLFKSIEGGKVIQANFYQQEVKIKYHVQPEDKPIDALTKLREAVFCAQYGKPLPAHCEIHSVYGIGALTARLGQAIAETGEIDARVEIYS